MYWYLVMMVLVDNDFNFLKIVIFGENQNFQYKCEYFYFDKFYNLSLVEFVKLVLVFFEVLYVRDVKFGDFSNDMSEFFYCC